MSERVKLPPYRLSAAAKREFIPDDEKYIRDFLDRCTFVPEGVKAEKLESQRMAEIRRLLANLLEWFREELNLVVGTRCPRLRRIRFYSPREWRKVVKAFGGSEECCGMYLPLSNEVVVLVSGGEEEVCRRLNHDLVHAFSGQTLRVKKEDDGRINFEPPYLYTYGYVNAWNKVLTGLNEAVTEMITIETLDYYRKKFGKDKDYLSGIPILYPSNVLFFDMLIQRAAERLGVKPEDVRKELYIGYLSGEVKRLSIFDGAFGQGTLKRLSVFTEEVMPGDQLRVLARGFGFGDELGRKFDAYDKGEKIIILGGIEIQRRPRAGFARRIQKFLKH